VAAAERVATIDVLRGVALFGVFLVNFTEFVNTSMVVTETQLESLPSAPFDFALLNVLQWLVEDKANTTFAFLFGLGFYLQMQRLEARGVDFVPLYRRRLFVLLAIGLIHTFFIWPWDILHLYALTGFILLELRRMRTRDLLGIGLILAVGGRTMQETFVEFTGIADWTGGPDRYSDAAVLVRQSLAESGDYFALVKNFFDWQIVDYLASGELIGWLIYVLGRFMIGAWVGRHQWISRAREFLPGWRRVLRWALPAGLIAEGVAELLAKSSLLPEWEHREFFGEILHLLAVPVLAAGYIAAVVVGFQSARGQWLLAPFAYVGRMALTNYLTQSFIIAFVLFGFGPGLALAGKIGTTAIVGIVIAGFAAQALFSRWWLGRYRYGPAEWVWRALTYGTMPPMRLTAVNGANGD
jgi:uncharacterized protein